MRSKKPELKKDEAFCVRCQQIKSKKDFYIRKINGKPFSYCISCQNEVKILKSYEKIERIVEERNGMCHDCGISYPTPVFDFYCDGEIYKLKSESKNISIERLKNKLQDHVMLCKNCVAIRRWVK